MRLCMIIPKYDLVRLQHGQSNDGSDNTSQELASSKAKSTASATLSGSSGTGRTRGGGGRSSRALGRSGGRERNAGARARRINWERACAVDLLLSVSRERPSHSGQLELGGEGQSRVLGILGIFECDRLEPDEAE
jgi:hypothetical protein